MASVDSVGGKAQKEQPIKTLRTAQLQSSTVADARHLLRMTLKDVDGKQEELRELVSVRYRDFIDAADTISAMGNSARTIIDTAGQLGEACNHMVAGSWREKSLRKKEEDTATVAKDVLAVMQAPERIASSIEQHKYVDAAIQLLSARERYETLQCSPSAAASKWLAVPFVRLRARTLMSKSLGNLIVDAAQAALATSSLAATAQDSSSAHVADALGASALVQGLSLRDALDTLLEARSAAVRSICYLITASQVASCVGVEEEEASRESLQALAGLLSEACLAVTDTVCQALHLFSPHSSTALASPSPPSATAAASISSAGTAAASPAGTRQGEIDESHAGGSKSDGKQSQLVHDEAPARLVAGLTGLSGLSGVQIRRDMLRPLPESDCCASVRAWLEAMRAAVSAAASMALQRVGSGKSLARLEDVLRRCAAEALAGDAGGGGGGGHISGGVDEPLEIRRLGAAAAAVACSGGGGGRVSGGGSVARQLLWGKVSAVTVWAALFAGALRTRGREVVSARFSSIQAAVTEVLAREMLALQALEAPQPAPYSSAAARSQALAPAGGPAGAGINTAAPSVQRLFDAYRASDVAAITVAGGSAHCQLRAGTTSVAPPQAWARAQCTMLAHTFLTLLQAAVVDCQQLVLLEGSGGEREAAAAAAAGKPGGLASAEMRVEGGGGGSRSGGGGGGGRGGVERAELLMRSARGAVEELSRVLLAEVEALEGLGGSESVTHEATAKALYVAQTAAAVSSHVPVILGGLPRKPSERRPRASDASAGECEARASMLQVEEASMLQLEEAGARAYSLWAEAVVRKAVAKLDGALRALKQHADLVNKAWEEVEVSVETEAGEKKLEKVLVPSSMLPHTLGVLLSAASAIHDVQTPPLLLHGPVVQRLVERLADALVAAYEGLGGDEVGDAEALCVQVVFDLNVSLDVLVGHARPVAIAARAKAVEQRLLRMVDPIDYSFLAPLLHKNRGKVVSRHSVLLGALLQRQAGAGSGVAQVTAGSSLSLPKPMNLLPLAPSDTRFALLPAVDTWSHHAAAASEGEGHSSAHVSSPTARPHGGSGKGGAGGGGGSSGGGKAGGVGAPLDMDDLQKNVKNYMSGFFSAVSAANKRG